MRSNTMIRNKYPVTNDHNYFGRTVNICNENLHHSLILIFWRIHIINFVSGIFACLKKGLMIQ